MWLHILYVLPGGTRDPSFLCLISNKWLPFYSSCAIAVCCHLGAFRFMHSNGMFSKFHIAIK